MVPFFLQISPLISLHFLLVIVLSINHLDRRKAGRGGKGEGERGKRGEGERGKASAACITLIY
jgi:hypothetical protein